MSPGARPSPSHLSDRMDLVIEGRVYFRGSLTRTRIGIEDGKITAIGRNLRGDELVDHGDRLLLPGAIDPHVHFRDPGQEAKEDFSTGTLAAAHAGVTTILDMPNNLRPVITSAQVADKRETVSSRAWVDFGLFGGLSRFSDIERMADDVAGFKLYMGSTTGNLLENDDRWIDAMLRRVATTGRTVSVHAEDDAILAKGPELDMEEHELHRPPEAEVSAIRRLAAMGTGARVNICHLSSAEGLAAMDGTGFTAEFTAHHLMLDSRFDRKGYSKVNPPLRTMRHREALMDGLKAGKLHILGSDHAPHTPAEKEKRFDEAPSGMPGVETSVPLLMGLVKHEFIDLHTFVAVTSLNPASVFGLRNKGAIEVGMDADLMVIDPKRMARIDAKHLYSKCPWTPFEGWDAIYPVATILRGTMIMEDENVASARQGQEVH